METMMENKEGCRQPRTIYARPWGSSPDSAPTVFHVENEIGVGGSSVCYEAIKEKNDRGVLKEFYPRDEVSVTRDSKDRIVELVSLKVTNNDLEKRLERYVSAYQEIQKKKIESGETASNLASCIPHFELYCGSNERGAATGYVWMPIPAYMTFEKICDRIRANPNHKPQSNLTLVLKTMMELADCTDALHREGMLHCDIKPGNIGFMMRNSHLLEQTLSFFDMDTICDYRKPWENPFFSAGFTDPAVNYENHRYEWRNDIYAIGATLFHAVVCEEEAGYTPDKDRTIRDRLSASPLLAACKPYTRSRLKVLLAQILEKCLGNVIFRYHNCGELRLDLQKALRCIAGKLPGEPGWDEEIKKLDKKQRDRSRLALQYHLFEHPLNDKKKEDVHVLLLGFGYYGQTFADSCLQMAQVPGCSLKMTIVSNDRLDKDSYLDARPELKNFVNVDGSLEGGKEKYADMRFIRESLPEVGADIEENKNKLVDILAIPNSDEKPDYIMIALGNDGLNQAMAEASGDLCENVYFIHEGERLKKETAGVTPVYVSENLSRRESFRALDQMAFNSYFVWEKDMNVDYNKKRKKFRNDEDGYSANIDFVLSMRCKLLALGISLDPTDPLPAAQAYQKEISEKKKMRMQLIYFEHRRWVMEKICKGWRAITDLEECVRIGDHRDKKNKRHACICRSQDNLLLREQCMEGKRPITAYWDGKKNPKNPKQLDELDTLSLELHRTYLKAAQESRETNWNAVILPHMDSIDQALAQHGKVRSEWLELKACMRGVFHSEQKQTYHYKALTDAVLREAGQISEALKERVETEFAALNQYFQPILLSAKYTDFKNEDVKLVDQIPFILTFNARSCLAVPFVTGSSSELFRNAAAALKVNPTELLYLYHCKTEEEAKALCPALARVRAFLRRKGGTSNTEVLVACQGLTEACVSALKAEAALVEGAQIVIEEAQDAAAAVEIFRKKLGSFKKKNMLFALEDNDSALAWLLRGAGVYKSMKNYRFDAAKMEFTAPNNCPQLGYIPKDKKPTLSVADIMALANSNSAGNERPEFYSNYKELWNKYGSNIKSVYLWKAFCAGLKEYTENNDRVAVFKGRGEEKEKTFQYTVSSAAYAVVERILGELKKSQIITEDSGVTNRNTESCLVTIYDRFDNQKAFNALFLDQDKLLRPEKIGIQADRDVTVTYDGFMVKNIELKSLKGNGPEQNVQDLLSFLEKKDIGCINCCMVADGKASFSFTSRAAKQLLTNEGRILELYVYHKLKASAFDDVVSSYEISWEGGEVKNEFDCIATRGYSSVFIECKARPTLIQDYYFKLAGLVRKFGVNAKAVLIADTREKQKESPLNRIQRERGRMMDVITIWKEEEINNIDQTLQQVLKGTYEQK